MATAGEGRAPYESSGAGGKFRKRPFRRSAPATPYDRPATALRNNKRGLLTKLVDPASRLIYAGANKLFAVFRKRLPPLSLQGPPEINEEPQNVSQESGQNNSIGVSKRINQDVNSASISEATGISDLEQMLQQKTFTRSEIQHLTTLLHSRTTDSPSDNITETNGANPSPLLRIEASTSGSMKKHAAISTPFVSSKVFEESTPSPADVAKSYMGTITRPTKLMNNTTPFQNTSITPKTANNFKNQENGFLITPRSHGRSAMYSMARTPYSRSPSQNTSHGTSLKRRSSVLEDDFGSVGPLRRTRQKPNLMLQSKKELGYTALQQPMLLKNKPEENGDTIMSKSKSTHVSVPEKSTQTAMKIFQQLESLTPKSPTKLTSNMLNGQALRSLEKVDSVKYLQTSQCNGESASTSRGKEKVEENGSRKFPVPFNMLTTSTNGNGDVAVLKESAQVVAVDDDDESALKLPPEPPQKKRAFQMSVTEIDDDDDVEDDDDIIHVNGHVSFPPVENNDKLETSPVVNKPVSADIIQVTTPPEVFKTPAPVEATPVVVEAAKVLEPEKAKPPPKTDGFFGEKESGFKFSSTFTAQKDEVTPAQKVSPFQFSEYKPKESSEPKPIESTSVFSSETKNDQFKVTNKDDKKLEPIPAATSASGMFSFASSAKNSSGPAVTPDSTPSVFSSLASFPASGGNTSSLFNNTSNSNITPATTSSLSSPTPVFSFGSGKAITSMPESSNTEAVIEKEPKSTISSSPFFASTTTTAATTSSGGGLFGFSSPAAASTPATTTTTTNGGGLFGFSSPAATSTTTAANDGGGLFGFSAPAATSTTTTNTTSAATNGGGLFGFSAPAATSTATATANGGAPFGFSSPAATSTTSTATNAGALFGFCAPAATSTAAPATNGGSPFGFSAPATTSTTTTTTAASATNGGALFGFSAPSSTSTTTNATNSSALFGFSASATTSTTTTTTTASPLFGFSSPSPTTTPTNSFFNTTTTTSQTNPSSTTTTTTQSAPFQFASGPTTSPTFGITPVSEGKSGNSTTTTVFGSSWQQPPPQNPPVFSFGASSSASTTPITFGAPKTTPSSSSSMFSFSSSSPVFPNNITNGNDQMSMEDSMAEDSMQTPTPVPSPFAQPAVASGFMFGAPAAAPAPAPFQFGGAAPQNPFQSSSVEFNGGGGSFSLGSGGEKAGRRIVRVNKSKNRRK